MENNGQSASDLATRVCAYCRKYKRRCDKKLPSCSQCLRMGRTCEYSEYTETEKTLRRRVQVLEAIVAQLPNQQPPSPTARFPNNHDRNDEGFADTLSANLALLSPLSVSSVQNSGLLRVFFLDPDIPKLLKLSPLVVDITTPLRVLEYLGGPSGIREIKSRYFDSSHRWMPFISRLRTDRAIDNALESNKLSADLGLLVLSMKLVEQEPMADNPENLPIYIAAKQFASTLENAGCYSLRRLQASLLITTYEIGHAILPAAYMTIGYCARQGTLLGIHDQRASQMLGCVRNWQEWEERERVWWFVIILDRYITLGIEFRPLHTEDPPPDAHIPGHDEAWDRGLRTSPERLFISSPANIPVGAFARLAQASHLLGHVIRHCNDHTLDMQHVRNEIDVLYRALTSLLELMTNDIENTLTNYVAVALIFSALMKLADYHSCDSFVERRARPSVESGLAGSIEITSRSLSMADLGIARDCTERCIQIMKETMVRIVQFVKIFIDHTPDQAVPSPLIIHCIYRATCAIEWMTDETSGMVGDPEEVRTFREGGNLCNKVLNRIEARWKSAEAYLEALKILEEEQNAE